LYLATFGFDGDICETDRFLSYQPVIEQVSSGERCIFDVGFLRGLAAKHVL